MNAMTATMVVSIVAMLGWLVLAMGNLQAFKLGRAKTAKFALAWIAIFGIVALLAQRMAG